MDVSSSDTLEQPTARVGSREPGTDSGRNRGRDAETVRKTIRFEQSTVERVEQAVRDGEYPDFSTAIRAHLPAEWTASDREVCHE